MSNLAYYGEVLMNAFDFRTRPPFRIVDIVSKSVITAMVFIGLVRALPQREFRSVLFPALGFLTVILLYPYQGAGFRFLIPITPLIVLLLAEGYRSVEIPGKRVWAGSLAALMIISAMDTITSAPNNYESSLQAFNFIRTSTPQAAVISFVKPRALFYYTGRRSFCPFVEADTDTIVDYENFGTDYVLICSDFPWDLQQGYVERNPEEFALEWSNERFKLYRWISVPDQVTLAIIAAK
jgi:hypothetical protein